jgi:hypothetical protein
MTCCLAGVARPYPLKAGPKKGAEQLRVLAVVDAPIVYQHQLSQPSHQAIFCLSL